MALDLGLWWLDIELFSREYKSSIDVDVSYHALFGLMMIILINITLITTNINMRWYLLQVDKNNPNILNQKNILIFFFSPQ